MKIFHAAALHLGSPFASLPPEAAQRQRKLQLEHLPRKMQYAVWKAECDLVLLAGDIFDRPRVTHHEWMTLYDSLEKMRVPVFIAPGNHDPYTADSIWATLQWPDNVHIFTGDMEAVTLPELKCRVWGAAFRGPEAEGLLRPIPKADDGFLEIGVFHGDPVYDSPYNPISKELLETCGLHYLALGHIHKRRTIERAGDTCYGWPGVPMGRGFDETGCCGALSVVLTAQGFAAGNVSMGMPQYQILEVPAAELSIPSEMDGSLLRLILTGESDPIDIKALHARLADRFAYLEIEDRTERKRDLWASCGDGTLRGLTMDILKDRYISAHTDEDRETALLAARYAVAALEGRDEP